MLLRSGGSWMSKKHVLEERPWSGVLDFRKAKLEHYGHSMQARLLSMKDMEKDILPPLQYARVVIIKDGGVLIEDMEIHFRASKSKAKSRKQTWWCVTEEEVGLAALQRMNPRCTTGFDANLDDE